MRSPYGCLLLSVVLLTAMGASAGDDSPSVTTSSFLPVDDSARLRAWYGRLGAPRTSESFGSYVARAARLQHGAAYDPSTPPPGSERPRLSLDRFECVSFIEASLGVARCGWRSEPAESCFVSEVIASRYRGGELGDYVSRLHYFAEWIYDNNARGRIRHLTPRLGGEPVRRDFFHITGRELQRAIAPGERLGSLTREMADVEARLGATTHPVLSRRQAGKILGGLEDGDVVAFVRERPGLLVHHAGFVLWVGGTPRLLHASSYHRRVVITVRDVTDYLLRRPERRGVMVARPLPP